MSSSSSATWTLTTHNQPTASSTSAPAGPQDNSPSSTLYLFTFLATLFVLLLISSAIVIRSFILRRRFRRQVAEAIAAGIYIDVTPRAAAGLRGFRVLGEKPKLYETWITPTCDDKWDRIMPMSAQVVPSRPNQKSDFSSSTTNITITSYSDTSSPPTLFGRPMRNPFTRSTRHAPPLAVSSIMEEKPEQHIAVSVLISMPSPSRSLGAPSPSLKGKERNSWDGCDDAEISNMILGVAELPFSKPFNFKPRETS